ncbi:hypothetical protein HDU76_000517, partial [Blyttiomyces sp. JEL0837]
MKPSALTLTSTSPSSSLSLSLSPETPSHLFHQQHTPEKNTDSGESSNCTSTSPSPSKPQGQRKQPARWSSSQRVNSSSDSSVSNKPGSGTPLLRRRKASPGLKIDTKLHSNMRYWTYTTSEIQKIGMDSASLENGDGVTGGVGLKAAVDNNGNGNNNNQDIKTFITSSRCKPLPPLPVLELPSPAEVDLSNVLISSICSTTFPFSNSTATTTAIPTTVGSDTDINNDSIFASPEPTSSSKLLYNFQKKP